MVFISSRLARMASAAVRLLVRTPRLIVAWSGTALTSPSAEMSRVVARKIAAPESCAAAAPLKTEAEAIAIKTRANARLMEVSRVPDAAL